MWFTFASSCNCLTWTFQEWVHFCFEISQSLSCFLNVLKVGNSLRVRGTPFKMLQPLTERTVCPEWLCLLGTTLSPLATDLVGAPAPCQLDIFSQWRRCKSMKNWVYCTCKFEVFIVFKIKKMTSFQKKTVVLWQWLLGKYF